MSVAIESFEVLPYQDLYDSATAHFWPCCKGFECATLMPRLFRLRRLASSIDSSQHSHVFILTEDSSEVLSNLRALLGQEWGQFCLGCAVRVSYRCFGDELTRCNTFTHHFAQLFARS